MPECPIPFSGQFYADLIDLVSRKTVAGGLPFRMVYLLIFTRILMIEKIENNIEGYF